MLEELVNSIPNLLKQISNLNLNLRERQELENIISDFELPYCKFRVDGKCALDNTQTTYYKCGTCNVSDTSRLDSIDHKNNRNDNGKEQSICNGKETSKQSYFPLQYS